MPEHMPSHLCFLHQIIFNMLLASLAHTSTSSFVTFSVQLIFSILHHGHILNASNSFLLALVNDEAMVREVFFDTIPCKANLSFLYLDHIVVWWRVGCYYITGIVRWWLSVVSRQCTYIVYIHTCISVALFTASYSMSDLLLKVTFIELNRKIFHVFSRYVWELLHAL